MNNQEIELRLQHVVDSNRAASKQLAMKTKYFNKKLHFVAVASDGFYHKLHEKKNELTTIERMLCEHKETLSKIKESLASLRHRIHRLQKKVTDSNGIKYKNDGMTTDDRYVYTKNALKKEIFGQSIKIRFHEVKTAKGITVMGYVGGKDKLRPFQQKIPSESEISQNSVLLWENIKFGSPQSSDWNSLFSHDSIHVTF